MTVEPVPLSPTPRTRLGRARHRGVTDRASLHALLSDALVAHVAVVVDGDPLVLPVAFAHDPEGPDEGGSLYLHGSVAARWFTGAVGRTVCVTVTEVDGLVLARSGFHHSMNYRSAVILGQARHVVEPAEVLRSLDLVVDHLAPGRSTTLRPSTRRELAATGVLAVPLFEASVKSRTGDPVDEESDVATDAWAGVVELARRVTVRTAEDSDGDVPAHVQALASTGITER